MIKQKSKEIAWSLLPIALLVSLIQLFFPSGEVAQYLRFLAGLLFVFIGLLLFLIGVDNGLTPAGEAFGQAVARSNRVWVVVLFGLLLGFLISFAEPSVTILALQVQQMTGGSIATFTMLFYVSIGVGVFVMIGLIRILYNIPLWILLLSSYVLIFILCLFVDDGLVAIAFDASGATTGILSVPFILSLSGGITSLKKKSKSAEKDSFGMIALASAGAIIGVLILAITSPFIFVEVVQETISPTSNFFVLMLGQIPSLLLESFLSILPLLLLFLLLQFFILHFRSKTLRKILFGFGFAWMGLTLFLNGVQAGFMSIGLTIGTILLGYPLIFLYIVSFLLGFMSIIAEPAVYVLTQKVEKVTSGYVNKRLVLHALAIGVGFSLVLNALRILLPGNVLSSILFIGYLLALSMMFVAPKLFVGIAFDAGGVASGPISATFIFAFSQGIAFGQDQSGNLFDLFGMIALIAMTPIVTILALGILYKFKSKKEGIPHESSV
ncbi:MAG: DUF1538 domain-containing protein [Candidatus Izemoplasmatales bacterium]|nr:DUF1538 domain-containing protein [Candidatus Izemoplasmatales bacterium]